MIGADLWGNGPERQLRETEQDIKMSSKCRFPANAATTRSGPSHKRSFRQSHGRGFAQTPVRSPAHVAICAAALMAFAILAAPVARADGEFLQYDLGPSDHTVVASIGRGAISAGVTFSDYDGGAETTLSLTHAVPLWQSITGRVGATLHFDDGEADAGLKLAAEQYVGQDWGGLFWLAEIDSYRAGYFALVQAFPNEVPLNLEVTASGHNDGYHETAIATGFQVNDGPVRLRAGFRLHAQEAFVGVSLNTF